MDIWRYGYRERFQPDGISRCLMRWRNACDPALQSGSEDGARASRKRAPNEMRLDRDRPCKPDNGYHSPDKIDLKAVRAKHIEDHSRG